MKYSDIVNCFCRLQSRKLVGWVERSETHHKVVSHVLGFLGNGSMRRLKRLLWVFYLMHPYSCIHPTALPLLHLVVSPNQNRRCQTEKNTMFNDTGDTV